eukprot:1383143-Rhodomonas_salina.3
MAYEYRSTCAPTDGCYWPTRIVLPGLVLMNAIGLRVSCYLGSYWCLLWIYKSYISADVLVWCYRTHVRASRTTSRSVDYLSTHSRIAILHASSYASLNSHTACVARHACIAMGIWYFTAKSITCRGIPGTKRVEKALKCLCFRGVQARVAAWTDKHTRAHTRVQRRSDTLQQYRT